MAGLLLPRTAACRFPISWCSSARILLEALGGYLKGLPFAVCASGVTVAPFSDQNHRVMEVFVVYLETGNVRHHVDGEFDAIEGKSGEQILAVWVHAEVGSS